MSIDSAQDLVILSDGQVMTDSRRVARHFGKLHRDVLKAIRNMACSAGFRQRNFAQCLEINRLANGKREPVVQMTKDGFMFLVMGFTGAKAAAVKEAFIEAFNRMADYIRSQATGAMERWSAAYAEYREAQQHASACGKDLCRWKQERIAHQHRLEQLDPQLSLAIGTAAQFDQVESIPGETVAAAVL